MGREIIRPLYTEKEKKPGDTLVRKWYLRLRMLAMVEERNRPIYLTVASTPSSWPSDEYVNFFNSKEPLCSGKSTFILTFIISENVNK